MEGGRGGGGVQDRRERRRDRRRWRGGGFVQEAKPYSECEAAQREAGGELHPGVSWASSAFPQTLMNVVCRESVAGIAVLEVLVISGCRMELLLNTHTR